MPTSAAELATFAAQSLRPPSPAAPVPAPSAAPESPAVPAAPAAPAVPAAVAPAATPVAPVIPSGQPDDLDAPFAPEVLATLGDAGQRALHAEREKRKQARIDSAAKDARIAELEAKLATPATPAAPSAPDVVPPGTDPAAAVPAPSAPPAAPVVTALSDCRTSADVDALVIRATREQSLAMELNTLLNTAGVEAVVERFKASKLDNFRGVPLDQLTPEVLASELATTYRESEEIKLTAPQQKQVIDTTRASMGQAVTLLPALKDANSTARKEFNTMASNPAVRALGPHWPEYVAQVLLGRQVAAQAAAPAPAAPAPLPPTPPAAVGPLPGAPRVSVPPPVPPSPTQEIEARLVTGNVTEKDMAKLAASALRSGAPVGAGK